MGGDEPSGPSPQEQQALADSKAKNRRDQQKADLAEVQAFRRSSSEGGLLDGPVVEPAATKPAKPANPLAVAFGFPNAKPPRTPNKNPFKPLFGGGR